MKLEPHELERFRTLVASLNLGETRYILRLLSESLTEAIKLRKCDYSIKAYTPTLCAITLLSKEQLDKLQWNTDFSRLEWEIIADRIAFLNGTKRLGDEP